MKHLARRCFAAAIGLLALPVVALSATYHTNEALAAALDEIGSRPGFDVSELATDSEGRAMHIVRTGSDDNSDPAILVVAGLDGRHLVGTEMALAMVQALSADDDAREKFEETVLYVIPRVNSFGPGFAFEGTIQEVAGINESSDSDRDGLTDEDGVEDLNGDGRISWIRVKDPKGTLIADGTDDALLREADPMENERGEWLLFREGVDDDADENFGEEADGGTWLQNNFPHKYEYHGRNSGVHQVSAPETRAIADFISSHDNIALVLILGSNDSLFTSPADGQGVDVDPNGGRWGRDPITQLHKKDVPYFRHIGEQYRELMGLDKEVKIKASEGADNGSLSGYVNLMRGRMAIESPVWSPEVQLALSAKSKKDDDKKDKKSGDEEIHKSLKEEQEFLDWVVETKRGGWLGWEDIEHPDFPGQEAQVGGFAPFVKINPPREQLDELATSHTLFLTNLVDVLPRVAIRDGKLKPLAGGVCELTFTVENAGYIPDVFAQGQWSTHVRPTRVELVDEDARVIGGPAKQKLAPIGGSGGFQEVRMMVKLPAGSDSVSVRVVSELGGTTTETFSAEED